MSSQDDETLLTSKHMLLRSGATQSQSYSHDLRNKVVSQTDEDVYQSMPTSFQRPQKRPRARTTQSRHRARTYSIDIQDPRVRRMNRSARSLRHAMLEHSPSKGSDIQLSVTGKSRATTAASIVADSLDPTGDGDGDNTVAGTTDAESEPEPELSRFSMFALTINFIIGVGVLDLPIIFYEAGIVLCSVLVVLATMSSNLAGNYVLESQSRGIMHAQVSV